MPQHPLPTGRPRGCALWLGVFIVLLCAALSIALARGTMSGTTATRELLPSAIEVKPGSFAFLRDGQVYLGRAHSLPRQLTRFRAPDRDPTHAGPLVWAPDNRHLAVVIGPPIVARDTLASATGALYVIDTSTGETTLVAPQDTSRSGIAVGPSTYAWADNDTVIYAASGQLYTFRIDTHAAAPVPGISGQAIDLEVRGHWLYYMSDPPPDGPLVVNPVTLRRVDMATHHDMAVVDLGLARFEVTGCNTVGCEAAPGVPSLAPAWDVSADGAQVAYERIGAFAPDLTSATATYWYSALGPAPGAAAATATAVSSVPAVPQPIFHGVPATLPADTPGECCYLRFAPDGRGLVLSSGGAMPTTFGPFLVYTRALAGGYQTGYPWAFGPAAWAPDAASFTLVLHQKGVSTTDLLTFASQRTTVLQDDAYGCAWALTLPASA